MNRSKTGLFVLTILAAMFFLFVAILFGSSTKRQGIIDRKEAVNAKLNAIAETDITIYWIGGFPSELEALSSVTNVISPENASTETLPVKSGNIHFTENDEHGNVVKEDIPRDYSEHMLIVITGNPEFSDSGKEALLDAITKNGVPVIALGDEAAGYLGSLLLHIRYKEGPGSSLYYCLGKGYKENPVPADKVSAGGMDLAEVIPDIIDLANVDYAPQ